VQKFPPGTSRTTQLRRGSQPGPLQGRTAGSGRLPRRETRLPLEGRPPSAGVPPSQDPGEGWPITGINSGHVVRFQRTVADLPERGAQRNQAQLPPRTSYSWRYGEEQSLGLPRTATPPSPSPRYDDRGSEQQRSRSWEVSRCDDRRSPSSSSAGTTTEAGPTDPGGGSDPEGQWDNGRRSQPGDPYFDRPIVWAAMGLHRCAESSRGDRLWRQQWQRSRTWSDETYLTSRETESNSPRHPAATTGRR